MCAGGHENLSPPFTTYNEQVDGKYWFPTYTKAEGTLHFAPGGGTAGQDVHIKSVVKYTDYKQYRSSARIIVNGKTLRMSRRRIRRSRSKPGRQGWSGYFRQCDFAIPTYEDRGFLLTARFGFDPLGPDKTLKPCHMTSTCLCMTSSRGGGSDDGASIDKKPG